MITVLILAVLVVACGSLLAASTARALYRRWLAHEAEQEQDAMRQLQQEIVLQRIMRANEKPYHPPMEYRQGFTSGGATNEPPYHPPPSGPKGGDWRKGRAAL